MLRGFMGTTAPPPVPTGLLGKEAPTDRFFDTDDMHTRQLCPLYTTEDLIRSQAFYCDHLGFEVAAEIEGYVELRSRSNPTVQLAFMKAMDGGVPSSPAGLYYCLEVDDVDAEHRRLAGHGLAIDEPPHDKAWGDRALILVDPNGIQLYLFTPAGSGLVSQGGASTVQTS